MSLFEILTDSTPEADKLAKGFLAEANAFFDRELANAYDLIPRFWYRNVDANGQPSYSGESSPTGVEILQAMGTDAEKAMAVAAARAEMLATVATVLGKSELVDLTKLTAPYELTFNEDGSVATATIREAFTTTEEPTTTTTTEAPTTTTEP